MIAVIGCGNLNRSDDGVGCEVIRVLMSRKQSHSEHLRHLDAGTDGIGVMFAAQGCTSLILVDACSSGSEPGAIFEIPGAGLARPHQPSITLHDFRWENALFAGRRIFGAAFPDDVTVLLVEAASLAFGFGLSVPVANAAGIVVARIEHIVQERLQQMDLAS